MKYARFAMAPVLAFGLLAAAPTPTRFAEGWRFSWRVMPESSDPRSAQYAPPSMSVQLAAGKLRMEMVGDRLPPGSSKGGYFILDAAAGTMTMVNPERKQAMVMEPGSFGAMAGAMGSVVKMDISDAKTTVEDLGAGERLLGRATHHYKITRSYAMKMSVFGKTMRNTHKSETEVWMSNELLADRSWEAWGQSMARGAINLGGDAMKKLIDADRDLPKGVPLRQIISSTDTDDKGKVTTSKTAMEMTELKKGNIDESVFTVPEGYEVVDMKAQMAEASKAMEQAKADCEKQHGKGSANCDPAQLNLDSLVTAAKVGMMEGLKEGVKEAAKESAKDAVKKGLLGKFRKPE